MKTRDRILDCALLLFNLKGEPNVSTLEIANELGISPGNLYYHFHGKEPLTLGLFQRFQSELAPLLTPPEEVELDIEDCWLLLHLIIERLAAYRFLFQDLSNLTGRLPKLEHGMRLWLAQLKRMLNWLLLQLLGSTSSPSIAQLVEQITLTLLFALDYQRIMGREGESRLVVYQVMMLLAPHLSADSREAAEHLAERYLHDE